MLYAWGRNSDGQCGFTEPEHPKGSCAIPHPVHIPGKVVHVSCGGGNQGSTAVVTRTGELFTFGNNWLTVIPIFNFSVFSTSFCIVGIS